MERLAAEEQRAKEIEFEIGRLQAVTERCQAKKETILNQEELIASLADEVKRQQNSGAKQSVIRE